MEGKLVFEIITGSIGFFLIVFPSLFIKLCAGLAAELNYENYKLRLSEVKKRGPESFNEEVALKHEKTFLKIFGKKSELYGPRTLLQQWLTRLLGLLFLILSMATLLNIVPFN